MKPLYNGVYYIFSYNHLQDFIINKSTLDCINKIVASGEIIQLSADRVGPKH